jgi:hypothetical protein
MMATTRLFSLAVILGIVLGAALLVGSIAAQSGASGAFAAPNLPGTPAAAGVLDNVEVRAEDDVLIANGASTTQVTALATDSEDAPIENVIIVFATTDGIISPANGSTDSTGAFSATLTSSTTIGPVTISATAVQEQTTKSDTALVQFDLARIYLPLARSQKNVASIALSAEPTESPIETGRTVQVTARLLDESGEPVTGRENLALTFRALWRGSPLSGVLAPATATVDPETGSATTTLSNPDLLTGEITVQANFAERNVNAETTVTWRPLPCNDREPNNGMNEATAQQSELTTINNVCIATLGSGSDPQDREGLEDDYYYLELLQGSTLAVELRDIPESTDYELSLTRFLGPGDTNPIVVAESVREGTIRTLTHTATVSSRYFIRVRATATTFPDNPYLLLVRVTPPAGQ